MEQSVKNGLFKLKNKHQARDVSHHGPGDTAIFGALEKFAFDPVLRYGADFSIL